MLTTHFTDHAADARARRQPAPASARPFAATVTLAAGAAVAIAAVGVPAAPAAADVTIAQWNSPQDFDYHVNWMPDLDQRRVGLPGSGGMHCIPTACMNLLAYAAQWGFPEVEPGPGTWTGYDDYYEMTAFIDELGVLMGTTADGGTGGSGKRAGLDAWIDGTPLVADYVWRSGDQCPSLSDIVAAVEGGLIAQVSYGRYDWEWGFQGVIRLLERQGGHGVTLMHASADGWDDQSLRTRDPADDNPVDVFGQSPFASRIYSSVETRDDLLHDLDGDGVWSYLDDGTLLEFNADPTTRLRMIDSYTVLRPISGASYNHVELAFPAIAGGGWITGQPPASPLPATAGEQILAVEAALGFQAFHVVSTLGPDTSRLRTVRRASGTWSEPTTIPFPVIGVATDVDGDILVAGRHQLRRLDGDRPADVLNHQTLACPADAIVQDDARGELLAWSSACTQLTAFRFGTGGVEQTAWTIAGVPGGPPPTTPVRDMVVCPKTGAVICLHEGVGSGAVYVRQSDGTIRFQHAFGEGGLADADSVACDDRGHLVVATGGGVKTYRPTAAGYVAYDDPWYAGVQTQGPLLVDRGRTNYDPAEHDTPGWNRNIPLDELEELEEGRISVPDCPGDFDGDGVIGFADLLGVLGAWGTGHPLYDVVPAGGDGQVGLDELLTVLAAWGPCS